jgi:hypothetical protein
MTDYINYVALKTVLKANFIGVTTHTIIKLAGLNEQLN